MRPKKTRHHVHSVDVDEIMQVANEYYQLRYELGDLLTRLYDAEGTRLGPPR